MGTRNWSSASWCGILTPWGLFQNNNAAIWISQVFHYSCSPFCATGFQNVQMSGVLTSSTSSLACCDAQCLDVMRGWTEPISWITKDRGSMYGWFLSPGMREGACFWLRLHFSAETGAKSKGALEQRLARENPWVPAAPPWCAQEPKCWSAN